ncbi:hypothetical protein EIN_424330 [Entamoeba invadens IP1]|uniref:Uncharacterized protein n=1 Tax=Entamoeba invadens IP1 TaxID=370355 RepID=A0A0A1U983_ENTIV|nr:hypothetical protein EIN_424330 [Entamoeba invadens IP1]ELP89751.1 hypothetical protein EIN_424330 [Entamoeba invadens IP1]|eukprot:XP_004256522.1 hypothetical protein EIN_424330 [Entamoeba invadens IP1]
MVVLKCTTLNNTFTVQFDQNVVIESAIDSINKIDANVNAIYSCKELDGTVAEHLKEMYNRVLSESLKTIQNEQIDTNTTEIIVEDLKRVFQLIFDRVPESFTHHLDHSKRYTDIIFCKKALDKTKSFSQLFGTNEKQTLKVYLQ